MKANTHAFNVELATKLGDVNEALILQHFYFWHQNNQNKITAIKDDHPYPWTYNTIEQFCNIFPYMKKTKLGGAIQRLVNKELLITGNYNTLKFDKTKWYSLTEKGLILFESSASSFKKSGSSFKNSDDSNKNTIPDSNTDSNTDKNKLDKKITVVYDLFLERYPKNRINAKGPVIKYLKQLNDEDLKLTVKNLNRYLTIANGFVKNLRNYLEQECWTEAWLLAQEKTNQNHKQNNNNVDTKNFDTNY